MYVRRQASNVGRYVCRYVHAQIYWQNVFAISYGYCPELGARFALREKEKGSLLRVELGHLQVKLVCFS